MLGSRPPPFVASEGRWMRRRTAIKNRPDLRRCLESHDVAQGLLEVLALGVEGPAGHADPDRAEEATLAVEHGRGEAAEVALELLALGRDAAQAHLPQLLLRGLRLGDGRGREALEARARVLLDGVARAEREHD